MADDRLRALERLVDAGEADPRALLALRDRARGAPLLPAPVCFGDQGYGGITECQPHDGGPCLGWGGEWTPLPTSACVLPPWEIAHTPNPATTLGRGDNAVLRRELVTGDLVLVPDSWWARCARCRGSGIEWPPTPFRLRCAMCGGTGEQPWIDPEGEAARMQPRGVSAFAAVQGDLQRLDAATEAQAAAHEIASRHVRPVEEVAARMGVSVDAVLGWHRGLTTPREERERLGLSSTRCSCEDGARTGYCSAHGWQE